MFGCKSGFPTPITAVVWNSLMMPNIKDNLLSAPTLPSCLGSAVIGGAQCIQWTLEGTVGHKITAPGDAAESFCFISIVLCVCMCVSVLKKK